MTRVMLIAREDNMPPLGSCGTVVGEYEGDLEVEIDGYPCAAGPGTDWLCDPRWVVYLDHGYDSYDILTKQETEDAVHRGAK